MNDSPYAVGIFALALFVALAAAGSTVAVAQGTPGVTCVDEPTDKAPAVRRSLKRLSGQDVAYPRSAIRAGIAQGKVKVHAMIDETGKLIKVVIVDAEPPRVFDQAVIDTLKTWKFAPDGQPCTAKLDLGFQLRDASGRPIEFGAPK